MVPAKKTVAHGRVTLVVRNAAGMEHELIGANKTKRLTLNLRAGHYALICNIPGHYKARMRADFTVR